MILKKMPTKELLERFLRGMTDHSIHVYFDTIKGEFVDDTSNKEENINDGNHN
jgi:hypothetical protein